MTAFGIVLAFLIALVFVVGFGLGFVFAIFCYPDKQEIIDRIKRDQRG